MRIADPLRIEKLGADHAVSSFDCGQEELNRFLSRFALVNLRAGAAQTYVALSGEIVVGYYSLAVGEVAYQDAPERLTKGLARHAVPIMLLARLAVSSGSQGQGIGAGLLKNAMLRTLQAADIAGIRALAVHAKDENARHLRIVPTVLSEDLHREGIRGHRIVGQGTDTVVDVGREFVFGS